MRERGKRRLHRTHVRTACAARLSMCFCRPATPSPMLWSCAPSACCSAAFASPSLCIIAFCDERAAILSCLSCLLGCYYC